MIKKVNIFSPPLPKILACGAKNFTSRLTLKLKRINFLSRNSLQLENPGRNQQEIEQISSRLTNYIKIIQQGEHQNTQENNEMAEESGEDEEDDMEMLDVYLSDKDPLTKKPIREPVKNPVSLKF